MLRMNTKPFLFSLVLMAGMLSNAQASREETIIISTDPPAAKEVIAAPSGYRSCFTVAAGWYHDVWIPAHVVCQYAPSQEKGVAWVEGYWKCNKYTQTGTCDKWLWQPAHWVKTFEVY